VSRYVTDPQSEGLELPEAAAKHQFVDARFDRDGTNLFAGRRLARHYFVLVL
jgi:hypothetical protein